MAYLTDWHKTNTTVSGKVWYDDDLADGTFVSFVPSRIDNMNVWVENNLYILHGNPRNVSQEFANQAASIV